MQIFFVSRKLINLGLLMLVIGGVIWMGWTHNELLVNSGYQTRQQFPPLVYLPEADQGPRINASAAVLIEASSGAILYAKQAELRRAPASTTKMMTAIVALEKGNLKQVIKVSRKASGTSGSTIWLKRGDRLTLKELLEGMMLRSGNDGSMAVAEGVAGGLQQFVTLMNLKAKEIGALKTNFQNPHGLRAPSHYTTALDLALIARYGLANPRFANLVKKKTAVLQWADGTKKVEIKNTNRLLWYLEGADGVKTGTTNEAGHCLVASATRDQRQFIAVVLNSRDRWGDCSRLLNYGFEEFVVVKVADRNQPVCQVEVKQGRPKMLNLYPRRNLVAVVKRGNENLILPKVTINSSIMAPIVKGEVLGKIGYNYREQFVEGVDLVSKRSLRRSWWFW